MFRMIVYGDETAHRVELHGECVRAAMENTEFNGDHIVIMAGQDGLVICGNEDLEESE